MLSIVLFITLLGLFWLIALFIFSGESLTHYNSSIENAADKIFNAHPNDIEANKKIIHQLNDTRKKAIATKSISKGLSVARLFADNLSYDLITDTQFKSVNANGVDCEWAIAKNACSSKRVLFLHGGAFVCGSARGHRKFSDQLSKISGAAVLSVNYRLLPKHKRMHSVSDAQKSYLWALDNGPNGEEQCDFLLVSGDSAGGNLAHMLSSWSKNSAPCRPDGVISFSPSLDQTLSNDWLKINQKTDPMLGDSLGLLSALPKTIRLWLMFIALRGNPSNPLVSPLFYDLTDLPPTLIHASSSEVLLGDSIHYVNKARDSGSSVVLQVWKDQVHDWHLFNMGNGSASVAWNEVGKFILSLQKRETIDGSTSTESEDAQLSMVNH